jgi:hypothetical protein
MTPDRTIQFLAQQDADKFPAVVDKPALLAHRLQQFGENPDLDPTGDLDRDTAAELAHTFEEEMEQAEAVYQALSECQRKALVQAIQVVFPPSSEVAVEELDQALL